MNSNRQRAVWRWVKQNGLDDLPMDYHILLKLHGIQLMSYGAGQPIIEEIGLQDFQKSKLGFSVRVKDASYIFYKPGMPKGMERHVIVHEIGHFAEGHNNDSFLSTLTSSDAQEKAAEEYVYELSPTPVLYAAGITTLSEIQRITGFDKAAALIILSRIAEYTRRDYTEEERAICKQFDTFIKRERSRRIRNKLLNVWIPLVAGAIISAVILLSIFVLRPMSRPASLTSTSTGILSDTTNINSAPSVISDQVVLPSPAALDSQTDAEPPAISAQSTAPSPPDGETVYWLEDGEVYHFDRECRHLKNIKDSLIRSGTMVESGKARACKSCGQ